MDIIQMCKNAKETSKFMLSLSTEEKNNVLIEMGNALEQNCKEILQSNSVDIENSKANNITDALIDRLTLNESRVKSMANAMRDIALLNDPNGEYVSAKTLPNGLILQKKRVPLGVIGIIYEARPNVTADAFGLCFKAGNVVILKGGKEAITTNTAIIKIFHNVLYEFGYPTSIVQLITDVSRESTEKMMKLYEYIDVLIPRGSSSLINVVKQNSTIPVIETGVGNCHIFVDESADIEMASNIVVNAKVQRPGVCNACETLLVHEKIAGIFLPKVCRSLKEKNVELRGDKKTTEYVSDIKLAAESDYGTEFLDYILAIKVVNDCTKAIEHISKYSTHHSEAIVTENYSNAQRFLNEIDAACVYVNASTRFTDGNEFGFGAEIGISTQKLHARGPMGLTELTSTKYVIYGTGQIRK